MTERITVEHLSQLARCFDSNTDAGRVVRDLVDARARIAELEARAPVVTVTEEMCQAFMKNAIAQQSGTVLIHDPRRPHQYRIAGIDIRAALTAALAVAGTGDGCAENWSAARIAFVLWAGRLERASSSDAASVIADIAPAEIVKAWNGAGRYKLPPVPSKGGES